MELIIGLTGVLMVAALVLLGVNRPDNPTS